jgi:hypothetical protein
MMVVTETFEHWRDLARRKARVLQEGSLVMPVRVLRPRSKRDTARESCTEARE